ncbi:transcription initiation factor TFIID subunit 4-like [Apium graveolens]|uniref:transcription initiation factor TFIID subunit 4-like n=1 Tax=Apium graveolens TaxID=4045 RepID=UPI003D7B8255
MAPKRCFSKEDLLKEFDLSMQIQRKRQKSSKVVAPHQLENVKDVYASAEVVAPHQFENFNDVTACAEIDLDEEQEQLFSKAAGNKASTSLQHRQYSVHQEEEMFLSKSFLRAKLDNIISKCGLKAVSKDVENCLLLGLGEMMDRLIRNMIKMSKQRVDYEKKRHHTLVTSDIHRHIMIMNRKCQNQKEPQDEKPNRNISDGEIGKSAKSSADGEIGKTAKSSVATKSKKKKIGTDLRLETAARTNKAVRASLGGDDFVSKWKLLSRKAQHEEDPGVGDQPSELMNKSLKGTTQKFRGKGTEKRTRQDQFLMVPKRVVSVKDVIRTLEREPQMSKSNFMYRLYERSAVAATEDENVK